MMTCKSDQHAGSMRIQKNPRQTLTPRCLLFLTAFFVTLRLREQSVKGLAVSADVVIDLKEETETNGATIAITVAESCSKDTVITE